MLNPNLKTDTIMTRPLKRSQRLLMCCDVCTCSKDHWKGSDLNILDFNWKCILRLRSRIERILTVETMGEGSG